MLAENKMKLYEQLHSSEESFNCCFLLSVGLQLEVEQKFAQVRLALNHGLEVGDFPGQFSDPLQLFIEEFRGQEISGVEFIEEGAVLRKDVDPPGDFLLQVQSIFQSVQNVVPRRFGWGDIADDRSVRVSPHHEILDERLGVLSFFRSAVEEEVGDSLAIHMILIEIRPHGQILNARFQLLLDMVPNGGEAGIICVGLVKSVAVFVVQSTWRDVNCVIGIADPDAKCENGH